MQGSWRSGGWRPRATWSGTMLVLAGTLAWLGARVLESEQLRANQQLTEQREVTADLVVAALEKRLTTIAQAYDPRVDHSVQPADAVSFEFSESSASVWPEGRLPYRPVVTAAARVSLARIDEADTLEHQRHDYEGALARLEPLTRSSNPAVEAAALVRVARNARKLRRFPMARDAYARLEPLGDVVVAGYPAALAAQLGLLQTAVEQGDERLMTAAAERLAHEIDQARWPLSAAAFDALRAEIARASDRAMPLPRNAGLAEAVMWLWQEQQSGHLGTSAGRVIRPTSDGTALLIWRVHDGGIRGIVVPGQLDPDALAEIQGIAERHDTEVELADANAAETVLPHVTIRTAAVTSLPWSLRVATTTHAAGAVVTRQRLLTATFSALALLLGAGGWFVGRSVNRELAVARLQTDFVAAVSHEFRTPLTTIYQLSELLVRGRVASPADRQQYYELLHSESDRLRRLVESLLDFGRLQSGALEFQFATVNVAAFVREAVDEFAARPPGRSHRFDLDLQTDDMVARIDKDTLRCALWNLLENAVKYSPDQASVQVMVTATPSQATIAVSDRGIGIPASEQRRIFDRFVRGTWARGSGIRGTGIGLAVARQIVRAHGGDIGVASAPGEGSTFTIVVPSDRLVPAAAPERRQAEQGI